VARRLLANPTVKLACKAPLWKNTNSTLTLTSGRVQNCKFAVTAVQLHERAFHVLWFDEYLQYVPSDGEGHREEAAGNGQETATKRYGCLLRSYLSAGPGEKQH